MTYADLQAALEQLCPVTKTLAVPRGALRYVALSRYGADTLKGDDTSLAAFGRVQLDVCTQDPADPLPRRVAALLTACCLPWDVDAETWDDELAMYRTIIQTEVMDW